MKRFSTLLLSTAAAVFVVQLAGCDSSDPGAADIESAVASAPTEVSSSSRAAVDDQRLLNAANEPGQWLTVGGTYEERHYSPLKQIDGNNVGQLGLKWFADYDTNLSQQGTPLYVDGVLYVSTAWSKVYAFDARNGQQLWQYDPQTAKDIVTKVCCGIVNRGIAAYDGKIYLGTLDGYLVAIDAATGNEAWRKLTVDPDAQYSITSAPRIVKGMVLIGNSGSEFGIRGYLAAYDAKTGDERWRFYTVPGNPADGFENPQMAQAASTWGGDWWVLGGGGSVWDALTYDVKNDLVIFGTGNGTPWNQQARDPSGGDNLFVASIIAVKPDTGEYAWHYQTTPGDTWDYDAIGPVMLLDLDWQGEQRRVVVQPNKNGFMYVLDAATGKLLKADPFTEVNWASGVDLETGRPIEVPAARFKDGTTFNLAPGVQGGHGWHKNSFNPETGLLYIATQRAYYAMQADPNYMRNVGGANTGLAFAAGFNYYRDHPDAPREFVGYVVAWDPVAGKEVWRSEEHDGPTGSTLATGGGLVFSGGGNNTNEFRAYDATTGQKLWSFDTQTGMVAGPITYELDGKQYVAASVGINQAGNYYAPNYSRLLVFELNGTALLPPAEAFTPPPLDPPPLTASAEAVEHGGEVYGQYCGTCHGNNGQARGANFPNLMTSPMLNAQEAFDAVVINGIKAQNGMASFADKVSAADSADIRAFLIARANELKASLPPAPPAAARAGDVHDDVQDNDE
ncbi:MAG: PQQ-dependent dehydrogenase, methanol/ethanol family [Gammaproteobacteria bacterium]|nr:PQQ-dependent dehydrogenase, methanol/ethanol family [Gammaproteobacteria bacterium]